MDKKDQTSAESPVLKLLQTGEPIKLGGELYYRQENLLKILNELANQQEKCSQLIKLFSDLLLYVEPDGKLINGFVTVDTMNKIRKLINHNSI